MCTERIYALQVNRYSEKPKLLFGQTAFKPAEGTTPAYLSINLKKE
jgi:hypothetical protein